MSDTEDALHEPEHHTTGNARPELEFFPVDIGHYLDPGHPAIPTDAEIDRIADLLKPFGACRAYWDVPDQERAGDAVEQRLRHWSKPSSTGNTILYWLGHGESDGHTARLAHAGSPKPLTSGGITPEGLLGYLEGRQHHPDAEGSWAIVVVDACKSGRFVELLGAEALHKPNGPRDLLLVATSTDGSSNLGRFYRALHTTLTVTYAADDIIDLDYLAIELKRSLHGCPVISHLHPGRALLRRTVPALATSLTTSLDLLTEIQEHYASLTEDERRHFLPKASGAELGELNWYFEGRESERDRILNWLATQDQGLLTVTGAAGSGKSALLGHVLVHTRPGLAHVLTKAGHLEPLPSPLPERARFDAVLHLTGMTPDDLLDRLAATTGHANPPRELTPQQRTDWLLDRVRSVSRPLTVLADALDEAHDPLGAGGQVLRRLAEIPKVRVVVGTRASTHEGPDHPSPGDQNLLDALGVSDNPIGPVLVTVERDSLAKQRYILRRLTAAANDGSLQAAPEDLERVATQLGDAPQEFLHARLAVHEILNNPSTLHDIEALRRADHRALFARAVQRLAERRPEHHVLLHALALAQGHGLPLRDGIWTTVAQALTPDQRTITDSDITDLTADAAPYLTLDTDHGQSVYRLAHQTFAEHFDPDDADAHQKIISALLTAAASSTQDDRPLNPYLVHHLSAHAGHGGQVAWQELCRHPLNLDRLDPSRVTADAMRTAFGRFPLPPEIAGTVGHQHLIASHGPADRCGLRELGAARYTGQPRSTGTSDYANSVAGWSVRWAALLQQALHLTLVGHTSWVGAVVWFPGSEGRPLLATGSGDGSVQVWDPVAGHPVGEPLRGHTGAVYAMVWFPGPEGRPLLATGSGDGSVRVWDPVTGHPVGEPLHSNSGEIRAVVWFPGAGGRPLLATGSFDGSVRMWDPVAGHPVGEPLRGHTRAVYAVVWFPGPDGRPLLATGSRDGSVRVWDPVTGRALGEPLRAGTDGVYAMVWFPGREGRPLLATGSGDGSVRMWDPVAGHPVGEPLGKHAGGVYAMMPFPDPDGGHLLATGSGDGSVRVWDPVTGRPVGEPLHSNSGEVRAVVWFPGPGGRPLLATGNWDRTVRVWDPATGHRVGEPLRGHTDSVRAVVWFPGPDGLPLLATGGSDGMVRVWAPATGEPVGEPLRGRTGAVFALVWFPGPDGRPLLATGSGDGSVKVWDPATGHLTCDCAADTTAVYALVWFPGPDGRALLATGNSHGSVRVWDPATGQPVGEPLRGHTNSVNSLVWFPGPDGLPLLATGSDDRTVRVWNPATGQPVGDPLKGHAGGVYAVVWFPGPDGRPLLATGSGDGMVRVWNPATGQPVGDPLKGHAGGVYAVVWFPGPDGRPLLATGGFDGTVRVWDPVTGDHWDLPLGPVVQSLTVLGSEVIVGTSEGVIAVTLRSRFFHRRRR